MNQRTIWEDLLGGEIRYYQAGDIRTRCLEAGRGEPLILLHGNGGHAEIFARNIMPLARRFRVYAVDMLGHGFTDKPEIDYLIPDYVRHVLHLMDAIGARQAHLLGHALAGWVATYLTVHHPERVKTLVNINGLTHLKEQDQAIDAGFEQIRTLSAKATEVPSIESVRKRLAFAVANPASITEELVAVRHAIYSQPGMARAMAKIIQVESPAQRRFAPTPAQIERIRIPVQLVFAEKHPVERLENFQRLQRLIAGSRLHVVPDAGILAMWEKPDEINQAILEFYGEQA